VLRARVLMRSREKKEFIFQMIVSVEVRKSVLELACVGLGGKESGASSASKKSNAPHCKSDRVQEDGNVHEKTPVPDIVKVIKNVLVDQERPIGAQLP